MQNAAKLLKQYILTLEWDAEKSVWLEHGFKFINSIFVRSSILKEYRKNKEWNL